LKVFLHSIPKLCVTDDYSIKLLSGLNVTTLFFAGDLDFDLGL